MEENLFINYRRGADQAAAGRLYDQLASAFGRDRIFLDVDGILPGKDFSEELSRSVAGCDIFLSVVGKNWADVRDGDGARRIDNPNDWVRIEIETALAQRKHVIPILVDGAEMPGPEKLPPGLAPFARRNAIRLTHERFRADVEGLVDAIRKLRAEAAEQTRQAKPSEIRRATQKRPGTKLVGGFIVFVLAGIGVTVVYLKPNLPGSLLGTELANTTSRTEPGVTGPSDTNKSAKKEDTVGDRPKAEPALSVTAPPVGIEEMLKRGAAALASKDYAQALSWYRLAADQGNTDAQVKIGGLYSSGRGVAQDYAQALAWYRKAADQGDALAQNAVGLLYEHGKGVAQDDAQAMAWYRKAADQGDASAQYNIGSLYEYGKGVAQDYAQALAWYRKAADQGNASAENKIGELYYYGKGVAQDYTQAMSWYRKAADQGYAGAQYNIGRLYQYCRGIAQDDAQALAWYRKAADQGNRDAKNVLQKLSQ